MVRVAQYIVFCLVFCNCCLFSFGHCILCHSSIYGFWLLLWYLRFTASGYPFGIFTFSCQVIIRNALLWTIDGAICAEYYIFSTLNTTIVRFEKSLSHCSRYKLLILSSLLNSLGVQVQSQVVVRIVTSLSAYCILLHSSLNLFSCWVWRWTLRKQQSINYCLYVLLLFKMSVHVYV